MSGATSSKSPTDRREWRQRPMAERLAYANKLLVLHPRFREAVALLDRCHQSSKQAGEPVCGAILGSSGVGKTSVVDHYRRLHAPRETDTASESCAAELSNAPPQRRVRTAWVPFRAGEHLAWRCPSTTRKRQKWRGWRQQTHGGFPSDSLSSSRAGTGSPRIACRRCFVSWRTP